MEWLRERGVVDVLHSRKQLFHIEGEHSGRRRMHPHRGVGAFAIAVHGVVGRRGNHAEWGEDCDNEKSEMIN